MIVHAHCDVPCGIYTPQPAMTAASTVQKMVTQIEELKMPSPEADTKTHLAFHNDLARRISTKEEHAQKCKEELLILWTDYFKPEHLEMFPDLHTKFWEATKLCSKNKQEINASAAKQLSDAVHDISHMFEKAEDAKHSH